MSPVNWQECESPLAVVGYVIFGGVILPVYGPMQYQENTPATGSYDECAVNPVTLTESSVTLQPYEECEAAAGTQYLIFGGVILPVSGAGALWQGNAPFQGTYDECSVAGRSLQECEVAQVTHEECELPTTGGGNITFYGAMLLPENPPPTPAPLIQWKEGDLLG